VATALPQREDASDRRQIEVVVHDEQIRRGIDRAVFERGEHGSSDRFMYVCGSSSAVSVRR